MAYLKRHPRNTTCTDPIPTSVVGPVLEDQLKKFTAWRMNPSGTMPEETSGALYICELIAADAGGKVDTWTRRLNGIIRQEYNTTSISTVDHFLVAMNVHHLWYSDPLVDYYFSPDIVSETDMTYCFQCEEWKTRGEFSKGMEGFRERPTCSACRVSNTQKWRERKKAA